MDVYDENDDYRGITLNICLGKLFCTTLYNRLATLLENKNILCKEQAGFDIKHRTTDHIFLLRTIIKNTQGEIIYYFRVLLTFPSPSIQYGAGL